MRNPLWRAITLVTTAAVILAACSAEPQTGASNSNSDAASAPNTQDTSGTASLPDPRSLTGLSEVPELGDPRVIEGNFTQTLPASVTDAENNSVTITDTSRILALDLAGNISRTVIALGYGDEIVGRTISSTETQLADLPVVTQDGHMLNAEAIINLRPTVVLADRSVGPPEAIDQVRNAGIPVVLLNPDHSIASVESDITAIADALGVPEAGVALAQRTHDEIAAAREEIATWAPQDPLSVAFLYVRGTAGIFFILGGGEGAADLIEGVGAQDAATTAGMTGTVPASAESLLAINPEVIFTMSSGLESTNGLDGLLARPGVAQTLAGSKQRVIAIPDGTSLSFGPQTGEILSSVARALYGVSGE
ncbi:MAG: ABC transporter substrate-binding protein [Arcanobacterium sp.]|nr:ABC transporter substrate-binding protein [Arcanobacterium sp.]